MASKMTFVNVLTTEHDAFSCIQAAQEYEDEYFRKVKEEEEHARQVAMSPKMVAYREAAGIRPPTNIDEFMTQVKRSGVATNYDPCPLALGDEAPTPGEKYVTPTDIPVHVNIPRTAVAQPMFEMMKELVEYAKTGSYDVPETLLDHFEQWQRYEFQPEEESQFERWARSETKKPTIIVLNDTVKQVRSKFVNETLRVLLFGCGNGKADVERIIEANGGTYRLSVDMYDPYVPIDSSLRDVPGMPHRLPGKDFPNTETPRFKSHNYHIILSMNSIHYNAQPVGGKYGMLDLLLNSLLVNGAIVGMFPSATGTAQCSRATHSALDTPLNCGIELLAYEVRDGVTRMCSNVFRKYYDEPVLDSSLLQHLFEQHNISGQVVNSTAIRHMFLDHGTVKLGNADRYPEVRAFNTFFGFRLPSLIHSESLPCASTTPFEFELVPGDDKVDYSNMYPETVINTGVPLYGMQKWRFTHGGPWLFSEKTNGFAANCRNVQGMLYIFSPGFKTVVIGTGCDVDMSFQAECIPSGDYTGKFKLLLLQLNAYNGMLYGFGSGLMLIQRLRDTTVFSCIDLKKWTYNLLDDYTQWDEGLVVMEFSDGPPARTIKEHGPNSRVAGTAIYVKRQWTVDVEYNKKGLLVRDRPFRLDPPPPDTAFPCVFEYTLEGRIVRKRIERKHGNPEYVVACLLSSASWDEFRKYLLPRYFSKWKSVSHTMDFLKIPTNKWTVENSLTLALSFPRGFLYIDDPMLLKQIYNVRKDLYNNPSLKSMVQNAYDVVGDPLR